jgi:uncharacterized protein DUF4333
LAARAVGSVASVRFRLPLVAILVVPALVAGCSGSVSVGGTTTVDHSDSVSTAQRFLAQNLTDLPAAKSVDCAGSVDAHPGTDFDCHATLANGQEVTLPLRVASVNGDNVHIISNPDVVDQALAVDVIYQGAKVPLTSVDCPTGIQATQGKTFDCTAKYSDGTSARITLKLVSASSNGDQQIDLVSIHKLGG